MFLFAHDFIDSPMPVVLKGFCGMLKQACDRIAGVNRFEELVAEQIDRDDALFLPDILDEDAGGNYGVDVLENNNALGPTPISLTPMRAAPPRVEPIVCVVHRMQLASSFL